MNSRVAAHWTRQSGEVGAANVWVVADARIDARADLIASLESDSPRELSRAPDVELILRAYLRWGEGCVEHLLGDFAFAIWDGRSRRLFCARDHMGVKPFYYAHVAPWLVFSNTLECLRRHPAVSDRLDDVAISDFLLFGSNQDSAITSYHDIKRLPPAHTLTWSAHGLSLRRYWSLPIDEPVYTGATRLRRSVQRAGRPGRIGSAPDRSRRNSHEWRPRFDAAGRHREPAAHRRRLHHLAGQDPFTAGDKAGSTGVENGVRHPVHAFTSVYDSLISDPERAYAQEAARHLDIPIHFCVADERIGWAAPGDLNTPEPLETVTDRESDRRSYSDMAAHSRVFFHGEGPDNALRYEWKPYLTYLYGRRRWVRLVRDVVNHMWSHRRIPLVSTVPRMIRERQATEQYEAVFPAWLNPELVARLDLGERWRQGNRREAVLHPVRPSGYASLQSPLWQSVFESFEPSYTGVAMEARHPHADIRLLRFMLSLPALPWCRETALFGARPAVSCRRLCVCGQRQR